MRMKLYKSDSNICSSGCGEVIINPSRKTEKERMEYDTVVASWKSIAQGTPDGFSFDGEWSISEIKSTVMTCALHFCSGGKESGYVFHLGNEPVSHSDAPYNEGRLIRFIALDIECVREIHDNNGPYSLEKCHTHVVTQYGSNIFVFDAIDKYWDDIVECLHTNGWKRNTFGESDTIDEIKKNHPYRPEAIIEADTLLHLRLSATEDHGVESHQAIEEALGSMDCFDFISMTSSDEWVEGDVHLAVRTTRDMSAGEIVQTIVNPGYLFMSHEKPFRIFAVAFQEESR